MIESISAVTLATHDMSRAVHFYRALGFEIVHGGENAEFTSFRAGMSFLNLIARPAEQTCFSHPQAPSYSRALWAGARLGPGQQRIKSGT